ncbi:MAG: hypothetical protein V1894_04025 [Chloroflexota bacterium]
MYQEHEEQRGFRHGHHGMGGMHGGYCGCGGHGHMGGPGMWGMMGHGMGGVGMGFRRRFISKDEIIARLEEYLKELQAEAKAVEERLAEIKKRGRGKD